MVDINSSDCNQPFLLPLAIQNRQLEGHQACAIIFGRGDANE
jgi:hypothetical protein